MVCGGRPHIPGAKRTYGIAGPYDGFRDIEVSFKMTNAQMTNAQSIGESSTVALQDDAF